MTTDQPPDSGEQVATIVHAAPTLLDELVRLVHRREHRHHAAHWWTRHRRTATAIIARLTRPESGLDEQFAADMHDLAVEVAAHGWDRAMLVPTEPIPVIDYHTVVDGVLVPQVKDMTATDVAFLGGVR